MQKILKNVEPSIRTYLGDAFCFSVIDDLAFGSGWIYDKYIRLEYTPEDGHIKYADYDYYDFIPGEGVFIKSFTQIPIGACSREYICDVVIQMLENGEYFFALWDENVVFSYLTGEEYTGIYEHGCFIYGYDSGRKMFYSQGYVTSEKWERFTVPFDVFYQALSYFPEKGEIAFIGYKVVENYKWEFDFDKMKTAMCEFLQETVCNKIYNIKAEEIFFEMMLTKEYLHYPSLYCMFEHKKIMGKRLNFLMQNHFIKENSQFVNQVHHLEKNFRSILITGIEYNRKKTEYLKQTLYKMAVEAIKEERSFMERLIKKLT